jgi:predicted TIM-barrel fold metal-dependent hydrolase
MAQESTQTTSGLELQRPAQEYWEPLKSEEGPIWCPLISVDDHVLELGSVFDDVPAKYRDSAPRMITDDSGALSWVIDGEEVVVSAKNAASGRPMDEWRDDSLRMDEMRRAVWDPVSRLADMDSAGIWASLNFPSIVWGFAGTRFSKMSDASVGLGCLRTYNDWMINGWCGANPDRYIPCQLPWLADAEVAANEIRRNADRGFRAVSFSENPKGLGFPDIYSDYWDPFFAACAETETVVNLHVGSSGATRDGAVGADIVRVALFPLNGIEALIEWVAAKVPIRHPSIKIVLSEGGASWVPFAIERLNRADRQRDSIGGWDSTDPHPVDLVRRNFWFASLEDPSAFRLLDVIGEDRVMVETDYPHPDTTWPDSQAMVLRDLSRLDRETIRKICYKNAADLYRHPLPPNEAPFTGTLELAATVS